ncbi:MAG TPA: MFS transporter [Gammaproteobacteria bacterium]|nr:MFS transporter [Gammaproteobacteria bacterium]
MQRRLTLHAILIGAALWGAGVYLRLPLLAVPPLVPSIHHDLTLNEAATGALTTLPALLFAIAAVPGAFLIARWGPRRTLLWGLLASGATAALRGVVVASWWLFLMTLLMGIGIAVMQPALPSLVRRWWPGHVGFGTALYTNGILSGELLAAGATLPWLLPALGGSWRLAFLVWALPAIVVAMLVIALQGKDTSADETEGGPVAGGPGDWWPDWADGRGWLTALILGAIASTYLGTNSLLPDYLHQAGAPGMLPAALASLNGTQLIASAISLMFANRLVGRRLPFVVLGVCGCGALIGLVAAPPDWAPLWCGILGFCSSLTLVLTLALPALLVGSRDTHRMSAMMFTIGYAMAFFVPLLSGGLWDLSGRPVLGFVPSIALMALVGPMALLIRFPGA